MVKIILEKQDIEKLILEKYEGCEIKAGISDDMEIVISMDELPTQKNEVRKIQPDPRLNDPPKKQVMLPGGSIDANASGLTLEPKKNTVPGGAMGQNRGGMPVY